MSPELCCSSAIWSDLDPVSLQSLKETMDHLKPSFCSHDVLPPRILKQIFDSVGPSLVSFLNKSLVSGTIPDSLKEANVTPLLKKSSLDTSGFNNFRPISNLPFITKALEKTVFIQLQSFLIFFKPSSLVLSLCITQSLLYYGSLMILCFGN